MAEIRRQVSPATSVPPPSPVVSTPVAPAPVSPVPISSAPAVPSWKIYTEFQKLMMTKGFDGTAGFEQVESWITEVERGFYLLHVSDDLKVNVGTYMLTGKALTCQVGDEQAKADKFLWGLNSDIYLAVNQFKPATYREATDRAIDQEKAMARIKSSGKDSKWSGATKTMSQASTAQRARPAQLTCHACGKVGHTRDQCHIATGACFKCGKQGHRIANCPLLDPKAQSQQARVQVMTHKEAAATDVITGTLPVNSDYAHVLFDSGGVMTTREVCRTVDIYVDGRQLSASLFVLDISDFDIILGMDWLSKHFASIDYHRKWAQKYLVNGCQGFLVSVTDASSVTSRLEDIPVVREFPDVFPKDFPELKELKVVQPQRRLNPKMQEVVKKRGKLKSRWSGPFVVTKVFPYGVVEISHDTKGMFKVNGQRLKIYVEGGNFPAFNSTILLKDP
ncbi:hypothetical protein SLEP1_g48786 [Rubroshorea leprosula]|uniref:CCHC-type domain-containing protein n=1 Tax=Rubroshorea leprosula TaxID=152421 RepID=A0AAV5LVI8_9ROSI|nr:hypothetical protein SLEP1_g48786 [Rubroshorea leprosula]